MKKLLVAGAAIAALGFASHASAATFPNFGSNTNGPALIITIAANGTASIANGLSSGPYDNSDDTYIGVLNNSSSVINSLHLTSTGLPIFGFEGDGIDTYGAVKDPNNPDTTGYGGPLAYFTNISNNFTSGDVNFLGGIAAGGSGYFSLEDALTTATFTGPGGGITTGGGVPEPATWAMMLVGVGAVGSALRSRRRTVFA